MAVQAWRMGFTSMNGRSPRDAKLFAWFTQRRRARVRRVGMKGLRSTRRTVIVVSSDRLCVTVKGQKSQKAFTKWKEQKA